MWLLIAVYYTNKRHKYKYITKETKNKTQEKFEYEIVENGIGIAGNTNTLRGHTLISLKYTVKNCS